MLVDLYFLLIPGLLLLAALFAAIEAALFSLSRLQLEGLRAARPLTYDKIRTLLFQPESLLSTLVIGNECINVMLGTFLVSMVESRFHYSPKVIAVISVLLSSGLLLTCSEILPKVFAFRFPLVTASTLVYPLAAAHWFFSPIRRVFLAISGWIIRLAGLRPGGPTVITEKDFLTLVEVGAESGTLETEEKERIANVFHFSDRTVASVMTPWERVFSLREDASVEDALKAVAERRVSRVPVLAKDSDRVVGVLYSKELLRYRLRESGESAQLTQGILPPYIVSSHVKVSRLFRAFKQRKVHIALVVDEFGKQVGLITLEDLMRSLFLTQPKRNEATL